MKTKDRKLKLMALRVYQRSDAPLVVFGVGGHVLQQFVTVDTAERLSGGSLHGYQRERVERHIREIRDYLLSPEALLPNAIIVSLESSETSFEPFQGIMPSEWGTPGKLTIRLPNRGERKPAFVIDGQQRMSALASLPPDKDLPVIVVGFISASEDLQRDQFVLVNKSKPLPRDLLNELLPQVKAPLPRAMQLRRTSATVLELLRYDRSSVFFGRIRGLGQSGEGANISQAAVIGVIESSMRRGFLSTLRQGGEDNPKDLATAVDVFFTGVARTWPEAWNSNPWKSRLVHGVGLSALGALMDVVMPTVNYSSSRATSVVHRRLGPLTPLTAWTSGRWPVLDCAWNALQNTSQDKRRLADYLVERYKSLDSR